MGNVFVAGSPLGIHDLRIEFKDAMGMYNDPNWIVYNLWDLTHPPDPAIRMGDFGPYRVGNPDQIPIKVGVGIYYAPWTPPLNSNLGMYKIVFTYNDPITGITRDIEKKFSLVQIDPKFANVGVPSGQFTPISVTPPSSQAADFSIFTGTNKTLKVDLFDDFGGPLDLTHQTSILLRMQTSPIVFERAMSVLGIPTFGQVVYMFVPADTDPIANGIYTSQVTVTFQDGSVIKTDEFTIEVTMGV